MQKRSSGAAQANPPTVISPEPEGEIVGIRLVGRADVNRPAVCIGRKKIMAERTTLEME